MDVSRRNAYLRIIPVKLHLGKGGRPHRDLRVLDTVRGRAGRLRQRAERVLGLWREQP